VTHSRPPAERFWEKVDKTEGCWLWTGAKIPDGYGSFRLDSQTHELAHRFAYRTTVGVVPPGLQLDHLCRNRACVNPEHLEPVTHRENGARGNVGRRNRDKTHCKHGHEFTSENTGRCGGKRYCRVCRRRWQREYRASR
jgi:hypothetical protein